jgi:hypothetical protein
MGEDFAAQMAGQSMAGGAGDSALLALPEGGAYGMDPYAMGNLGRVAPSLGGAEASLYDPAQLANPQTAMGPRESTWLSRFGDKIKDPKTVMRLGQMAAQMGAPRPQGGPQGFAAEQPSYRSAMHSQEDITKAWLLRNDPNTYRRIYGNPQGVA